MVLDTAKLKQAFGLAFREKKALVPLLVLFGYGMFVVSVGIAALMPVAALGRPIAPSSTYPIAMLAVITANTIHFLLRIWLFRARSLGIPLDAALFVRGIRQGFLPVLGLAWAVFWRIFVAVVVLTGIVLLVDPALLSSAPGTLADTLFLLAGLLLLPIAAVYLIPFYFTGYLRAFHPAIGFAEALRRLRYRIKGRRLELTVTLLVASLPIVLPQLLLQPLAGLGPWLALLFVPLTTIAALPASLVSYLYYEEFETLEGLHPEPGPLQAGDPA